MEFNRDRYLRQLIERMDNGLIKVVTGERRVGKSYLLNTIFLNHIRHEFPHLGPVFQFAFDSADDLAKIGEKPIKPKEKRRISSERFLKCFHASVTGLSHTLIILDEVQLLEDFEAVLNGLLRNKNFDIYVTGSNSRFLSTDIITEFRGRGDPIHVYPLSFADVYEAFGGDKEDVWAKYITYGGLPLCLLAKTDSQKVDYLRDLCEETYLKDIIDHNSLENVDELKGLFSYLASVIGSPVNPKKISDTLKSVRGISIDDKAVSRCIGYFKESYLLSIAERYDVKGKRYFASNFKEYFEDLGIRNAQLSFRQIEETHLMENAIYNELKVRGYLVDVGVVRVNEPTLKKDINGRTVYERKDYEVDFVASLGNEKYYIQSAYSMDSSEKEVQEKRSLVNIGDSFKKIIITKSRLSPYYDESGVLHLSLFDFLLDPDSLKK